jgi:hypothetical protein
MDDNDIHSVALHFRWCASGDYFARMTTDTLSIYETPVRASVVMSYLPFIF